MRAAWFSVFNQTGTKEDALQTRRPSAPFMAANNRRQMTGRVLSIAVMMMEMGGVHAESAEVIGRYTSLAPIKTVGLNDLLAAPVIAPFGSIVTTVGGAVGVVLRGTGYLVSSPSEAPTERAALLALPLPATHHDLSGRSVRAALETLAGPTFKLVEDPVHRLVSFERCHSAASPVAETAAPP